MRWVIKENIGGLEEEEREGFNRWKSNRFIGLVRVFIGKKRYLVIFQYEFKKEMGLDQLTDV